MLLAVSSRGDPLQDQRVISLELQIPFTQSGQRVEDEACVQPQALALLLWTDALRRRRADRIGALDEVLSAESESVSARGERREEADRFFGCTNSGNRETQA